LALIVSCCLRIVGEIIRVAKRVGADATVIEGLEAAAQQTQFKRAVKEVNPAIPEQLLVCGENPLTLLHKALSEGLHAETDDKCLEFAQDIRLVLSELAEGVSTMLKDQNELQNAVNRLTSKQQKRAKKSDDAATE
jgi:hypothetical protein